MLKAGDLAKIDLGAHIDGFIAVVAHTVHVGGGEITGRKADVLLAAHYASEAALRLARPGNEVPSFVLIPVKLPVFLEPGPVSFGYSSK